MDSKYNWSWVIGSQFPFLTPTSIVTNLSILVLFSARIYMGAVAKWTRLVFSSLYCSRAAFCTTSTSTRCRRLRARNISQPQTYRWHSISSGARLIRRLKRFTTSMAVSSAWAPTSSLSPAPRHGTTFMGTAATAARPYRKIRASSTRCSSVRRPSQWLRTRSTLTSGGL